MLESSLRLLSTFPYKNRRLLNLIKLAFVSCISNSAINYRKRSIIELIVMSSTGDTTAWNAEKVLITDSKVSYFKSLCAPIKITFERVNLIDFFLMIQFVIFLQNCPQDKWSGDSVQCAKECEHFNQVKSKSSIGSRCS